MNLNSYVFLFNVFGIYLYILFRNLVNVIVVGEVLNTVIAQANFWEIVKILG